MLKDKLKELFKYSNRIKIKDRLLEAFCPDIPKEDYEQYSITFPLEDKTRFDNMFRGLVDEFPKQEKQLDIIFRKLGLDKSFPNPESSVRRSGKTVKRHIRLFVRMFLLKEFSYIDFVGIGNDKYTRATFESKHFGQMLEKLYPKEILEEYIERTQFGFEIIKDFDREVKEETFN